MSKAPAQPVTGSVVAVTGVAGPPESIRYTIRINMPGGGIAQIENVRPTVPTLWAGLDVRPFPVGWPVERAYLIGKTLVWYDAEGPDYEDCEGPEPQPIMEPDPLRGVVLGIDGQPTNTGGTGGSLGIGSGGFTPGTIVGGDKGEGTI